MPAITETYSLGIPVEIGNIDQELKKLWRESEGAMTRASLMNLAVYGEQRGSLEQNTQLMARITEDHACRAIVIEADCGSKDDRVDAWISTHCHLSREGSKQVCSEQISFLLKGECGTHLPSIILSNLDSDLPLYLWWQEEFREPMDPQLWGWVDRVIYDSRDWSDFPAQMGLVERTEKDANHRIVLCDLNWTRLDKVRFALAQFFDHPASHHRLSELNNVRIDFAPGFRSTAVLFAGWLGAQLGWCLEDPRSANELRFGSASGSGIDVELSESEGEPIQGVVLTAGDIEFCIAHAACGDLLEVSRSKAGEKCMPQLMPAGKNDSVSLISEELMRGGLHHVYLHAVNCIRELL
ncbi:MAG TPA: glucose-6-phosphate dehydrogenase assembly protein OpcA [Candidatus Udaeobacter sp.]|jgi:glucose-6-phosphate dehydrogenase assembly protein OpcA|nr:glucose-6-phosphate dehydrogenase assembly protein OpcA [Candidatus Udaeobacter sp.]